MKQGFDPRPATIMVVDDDVESARLLECALLPLNFNVVKAHTGKEALSLLEKVLPDLILLDVLMPDLNGFEICSMVKEKVDRTNYDFIPVIMVTALSSRKDKIRGLEAGADDFISKPMDLAELVAKVKSLLRIKYLHQSLQKSYEELKRLERVKDLLTQMIVHDLKNPLTAIMGSLELLDMKLGDSLSPQEQFSPHNILHITHRMQRLINNLLDITRMEEGKLGLDYVNIEIDQLFQEIKEMFSSDAHRRSIRIVRQIDDVPVFKADRGLLVRILENLVSNSIKSITSTRAGLIVLKAWLDGKGQQVVISVMDNGCGIPERYQDKIFDKFEQVRMRKEGERFDTGLGLTFCKLAIETHKGQITVKSREGEGSEFIFTLPLVTTQSSPEKR